MTNQELINLLSKFDPDLTVVISSSGAYGDVDTVEPTMMIMNYNDRGWTGPHEKLDILDYPDGYDGARDNPGDFEARKCILID